MKAYLKNQGVAGKLNMNDAGKVYMRDVNEGDNVWEQWTFDLNELGHISNVAIDYKVLDSKDEMGGTYGVTMGLIVFLSLTKWISGIIANPNCRLKNHLAQHQ